MNELYYIVIFLLSVLISAISQLLLKSSALEKHESLIKEYLNLRVFSAYALFIGCTFLTVFAYKGVPLSMGPLLEATGYIYIALFSSLFLREKITKRKLLGNIFIIIGIIIFTI